ncbi:tripartite motif-containing protein 2-like [Glandiceps talaboti]
MTTEKNEFMEKINANFLNCGICSERYQHAKRLPCMHNFCEKCLSKLAGRSSALFCPLCTEKHTLPITGVADLPNNFFLNELVRQFNEREEKVTESNICGGCREGENSVRCIECGMFLCKNCAHAHQNIRLTRIHQLMSVDVYNKAKVSDPVSVQPSFYCDNHPIQPLKFYCDKCEEPICLECTAFDHKTHNYRLLKDAATEYTRELEVMVAGLKVKEKEAETSKQAVQTMSQSLDNRIRVEEKKLNDHMEKTIMDETVMIQVSGNRLMENLAGEYESRKQRLEAQHKELDIAENYLTNVVGFTEEMVHDGNAAKIMSAKKEMASHLKELTTIEIKSEPLEGANIEFKKSEDFFKDKSLGVIISSGYELSDVPKHVRRGEQIQATLTRRDIPDGKTRSLKIEDIKAVMKTPDNEIKDVKVTDNNNDTFSVRYTGTMTGCHELSVKVRNKPVVGSPVQIKVNPKIWFLSKM